MLLSLESARSLRFLCLRMPAASSMSARRSSGLELSTVSRLPWLMIECVSRPSPVSESRSWMSMSRAGLWLRKYSLSPLRNIRRVIVISVKSIGIVPSELSSTRSTSATPTGLRAEEPAKMTSSMDWPRSCLADCSPSTHRTASVMLDLPEPLGPTTTVTPGLERHHGAVGEGLEAFEGERLEVHACVRTPPGASGRREGARGLLDSWPRRAAPRLSESSMKGARGGRARLSRGRRRASSIASAAAAFSAAFLDAPEPRPTTSPSTLTSTVEERCRAAGPLSPVIS